MASYWDRRISPSPCCCEWGCRSPPPSSAIAAIDLSNIAGANQSSGPIRRAARLPPTNRQRARPRQPEIPERSTAEIPSADRLIDAIGRHFDGAGRWSGS